MGLSELHAALARTPARFFIRDDDGGWDDAALAALLEVTAAAGVPVDVAVIPSAATPALAALLKAAPRVGVHQHGWSHANHETEGRRCEFGAARALADQQRDIVAGRARLAALFGAAVDSIFTPPWNRCAAATPALLAEAGLRALSRSRGAPPQNALPELPIDVDWCRLRREATTPAAAIERIGAACAERVAAGGPVGLMLHHAAMDGDDRAGLAELLAIVGRHPNAACVPMRALLS
jgi:hypothetical protein